MRIDAHHHLWNYNPEEYAWIDESMGRLQRSFLPEELHQELGRAGIDGVVSVQARQSLVETKWLLALAETTPWMLGIVGWVDLRSPELPRILEDLKGCNKLKGLRHVIQGETESDFILGEAFNRGIQALKPLQLAYDILIFEHQLPQTIRFVDRHPGQRFVLDHLGKPAVKGGRLEPWRTRIRELALRPHVCCKLSGLVTEAHWDSWNAAQLLPYFETVLEAFGPRRLLFGSDWPVCLVASSYGRWRQLVGEWIAHLSEDEQARIMGDNAREAYKL